MKRRRFGLTRKGCETVRLVTNVHSVYPCCKMPAQYYIAMRRITTDRIYDGVPVRLCNIIILITYNYNYIIQYYFMLHYTMLRYVKIRYVMLRYIILYYVTLKYVMLRYKMLCLVTLYYIILSYTILYYITLKYVTLYYVMLYCIILYYVLPLCYSCLQYSVQ